MKKHILLFLTTFFLLASLTVAEKPPVELAWDAIKTYQYGNDLAPLILVERDIRAHPQAVSAARLAALLNDETTLAGRQFVCLQLRFVGTSAEVPVLAKYLHRNDDFEHARMALQAIAGEEALVPLREALHTFQGKMLVGVIESLAVRKDTISLPALIELIDSEDQSVAAAAIAALGAFENEGLETLMQIKTTSPDLEQTRLRALLRIASTLCGKGQIDTAGMIYEQLADSETPRNSRRAALEGQLQILSEATRYETLFHWFFEEDFVKRQVAVRYLYDIPSALFDELTERLDDLPPGIILVMLEIIAERQGEQTMETLRKVLEGGNELERLFALRAIGATGDVEIIPLLVMALKENNPAMQTVAAEMMQRFPHEAVLPALLPLVEQPESRQIALDILSTMKCYPAIDPLIRLAQSGDASLFAPVIAALGRICDPDEYDIPRMMRLYLSSRPGIHRDNVERAVVVICEKNPDANTRANLILDFLQKEGDGLTPSLLVTTLPLLGRLGNQQIADKVLPLLQSDQLDLQRVAIRALCNWPNADYHGVLWEIVQEAPANEYTRWALRAYIRVVTLRSDRPESETLSMLQKAMQAASDDADKQWCLSRSSTIRTMETVDWATGYLDDPVLAQTACEVIAELARHRFLREPNKDRFDPILDDVERTTQDARIIESVQRSRLGM
ncbi:MAG: HEAT repeat domain-containing protein [Planctomycetaceae bacterium]|nr:HEAT repeat domain-containing protein [Planctomycetaceae bacterium]